MTSIDLDDAAKFIGGKVTDEIKAAMRRGLFSAAKRMASMIVGRYIPTAQPPPVDRGEYKAAWNSGKEGEGAFFENTSAHAPMVEYGVRAGRIAPSRAVIAAVAAWAVRKGMTDAATSTRVAFAIVNNLKSRGIVARAIMEKANNDLLATVVNEELERELTRAVRKL